MTYQTSEHHIEDCETTRALVETGLMMVAAGAPTISAEAIHAWLLDGNDDVAFPKPHPPS